MLEPLGVSAAAEAVYRLLLSGSLTFDELRLFTRLTPVALRRHLSELAVRGLVVRDPDGVFQARSAQRLLESVTRRQEMLSLRQAAQRTATASRLVVDAIRDVCAAPEDIDAQQVDSRIAVIANLRDLTRACRHETMRINPRPPKGWLREHAVEFRQEMYDVARTVVGRGISSRQILETSTWHEFNSNKAVRDGFRAVVRAGRRHRVGAVADLPQFNIFDRRVAFVPLLPVPGTSPGGYIVREPGFSQRLALAFDELWAGSVTADVPNVGDELSSSQRTVIEALAGGASDEAIARKLALSRRTVARVVAELMTIAGTTSRFQLGVAATARGWLSNECADRIPAQRSDATQVHAKPRDVSPLAGKVTG